MKITSTVFLNGWSINEWNIKVTIHDQWVEYWLQVTVFSKWQWNFSQIDWSTAISGSCLMCGKVIPSDSNSSKVIVYSLFLKWQFQKLKTLKFYCCSCSYLDTIERRLWETSRTHFHAKIIHTPTKFSSFIKSRSSVLKLLSNLQKNHIEFLILFWILTSAT